MSYLRALDTARSHLDRGDLLAAEAAYQQAHDEWQSSRIRAPLVERGIEPALRRIGGWFGRRSSRPVLPVFGHRAAVLEDDLHALARLLHDEALAVVARSPEDLIEADRVVLENALRLDRESRFFSLDQGDRWPALRGYLESCRRLARTVESTLLPAEPAGPDDEAWLRAWSEAVLGGGGVATPGLFVWIENQAASLARIGGPGAARWNWVAARAALRDPAGGERALEAVQDAIRGGLEPADDGPARRVLAGLLVNESLLAGPGADVDESLERWRPADSSATWPPTEIEEIRRARRDVDPTRAVASAAWDDEGRHLVLVLHDGTVARDALALAPRRDTAERSTRFEASLPEARGWIQRWLPEDALVLVPADPPAHLTDLLAGHPILDVGSLLEAVPSGAEAGAPDPPGLSHPLWAGTDGHAVYQPLATRARETIPRLRAWSRSSPAFSEPWGRRALDVMAQHGLETCGTLRDAIDRLLGPADGPERTMQDVDLVVPLQWPRLEARDWPAVPPDDTPGQPRAVAPGREGCIWFDRVAGVEELVGIATASDRAELLTVDSRRAAAVAARAAGRVDARRVTVAPERAACPEPWLDTLDEWMRAAVGDAARQRDVLWLWRLLAEAPSGAPDLGPASGSGARRRVHDLAMATQRPCDEACRLTRHGGCWAAQLEGRRETSRLWIVPVDRSSMVLPAAADVLVDDLRSFVTRVDDDEALRRLQRVTDRACEAQRAWVWSKAGRLDAALRARWTERVDRPLVQAGEAAPDVTAIGLVAPGYRPGDDLLAEESRALIQLRAEAWQSVRHETSSRSTASIAWWESGGAEDSLQDPGTRAVADHVVTPRLAGEDVDAPLLLLLRAAAAQAHARRGWFCLDPRLAHVLGHAGGMYPDADVDDVAGPALDAALRATFGDGRDLLAERAARNLSAWIRPVTASRLAAVARQRDLADDFDPQTIAEALRDWERGRPLVVGGATDRQRSRVIDLVHALAERSGDGGPLGVRCVFVIDHGLHEATGARATAVGPDDDERLGAVMLEAERGRVTRVDLHPALLRDDALRAWARRVSSVAWVFPRLDAPTPDDGSSPDLARLLPAWREVLERSGAAALGFVDAVDHGSRGAVTRWASALDARVTVLPTAERADQAWRIGVETIGPVTVACWKCTRSVPVDDDAAKCPSCAAYATDHPGSRRAAATAVEDELVHRLHARQPRTWWAITTDPELAVRVRERLGLTSLGVDQAPLLAAVAAEPDDPRVLHVDELDGEMRPPADLLWLDVPDRADEVRRVLRRLAAMEAAGDRLELLVPPVGLRTARPRAFRGLWRWTTKRVEVEFRLRELDPRDDERAPSTGLRPEARGPDLRGAPVTRRAAVLDDLEAAPRPRFDRVLDALESAGLGFGHPAPVALDVARLPEDVDEDDVRAFLQWGLAVGVLEGTDIEAGRSSSRRPDFERRLRAIGPAGQPASTVLPADVDTAQTEPLEEPPEGALRCGIGRSQDAWLLDAVDRAAARGERSLLVVGRGTGRARWQGRLRPGAEVVDVEELAMAFLDDVARERGVRTRARLLPASGSAEGEEARLRLMRETSRRYAQGTGRIPALEAQDLRRAAQGEVRSIPRASAADVDLEQLDRCAAEARAAAGWLTSAELREASVNAVRGEAELVARWRRRYPWMAVDGIHDFSEKMLDFVRALFPSAQRWETLDPLLGVDPDDPTASSRERDGLVADLPRDTLRAIETLRRNEPDDLGRLRARGRQKARVGVERVRVLTLRAAAEWILENVAADRQRDRTGVVVAHEDDRNELGAALRRGGLETLTADSTANILADGPRHVLAALHLLEGESTPELLDVLASLDPALWAEAAGDRHLRWSAADRGEAPGDPSELRLARLHGLRGRIPGSMRLADAVGTLLDHGILDRLLDHDAASGRLRDWVVDHGHRAVDEMLTRVAPALVARPDAPTRAVLLLGAHDLVGPDHDHLIAIGTGYEPVARTVRVLLRAPEHVTVLYSERDPLA